MTSDEEAIIFEDLIKSIVIELNKPVVDFRVTSNAGHIISIKQVSTGLNFYILSHFQHKAKGEIKVCLSVPKNYKSHSDSLSGWGYTGDYAPVGISATRPAHVIAKSIKSRFLDKANEANQFCIGELKEQIKAVEANEKASNELYEAFGSEHYKLNICDLGYGSFYMPAPDTEIRTTALNINNNYCTIEAHYLPLDLAATLLQAIKDYSIKECRQ